MPELEFSCSSLLQLDAVVSSLPTAMIMTSHVQLFSPKQSKGLYLFLYQQSKFKDPKTFTSWKNHVGSQIASSWFSCFRSNPDPPTLFLQDWDLKTIWKYDSSDVVCWKKEEGEKVCFELEGSREVNRFQHAHWWITIDCTEAICELEEPSRSVVSRLSTVPVMFQYQLQTRPSSNKVCNWWTWLEDPILQEHCGNDKPLWNTTSLLIDDLFREETCHGGFAAHSWVIPKTAASTTVHEWRSFIEDLYHCLCQPEIQPVTSYVLPSTPWEYLYLWTGKHDPSGQDLQSWIWLFREEPSISLLYLARLTLEQLSLFHHLALPLVKSMLQWAVTCQFEPADDWVIQCLRQGMIEVRSRVWIAVFGPKVLFEVTPTSWKPVELQDVLRTYAFELRSHWLPAFWKGNGGGAGGRMMKMLQFGQGKRELQIVMGPNPFIRWSPFNQSDEHRGADLVFFQQQIQGTTTKERIQGLLQSYSSSIMGRMLIEKWLYWKIVDSYPTIPYSMAMMRFVEYIV